MAQVARSSPGTTGAQASPTSTPNGSHRAAASSGRPLACPYARLWATNGVALCSAANDQTSAIMASDGAGGAIASWDDTRTGVDETYAQRISPAGVVQWAANGVAVTNASGAELQPAILADGAGG